MNTHIRVCVFIVVQNIFKKQNAKYLIFFIKRIMLELKLKWGIIFWISSVGCLTTSPYITELSSPKFFVRDFWFILIKKPLKLV